MELCRQLERGARQAPVTTTLVGPPWRDPSEERTDGTENVAQRHENERNALRSLSTRCSMTPDAGTLAPVHGPPVPWRGFLKAMGEAGIVQRPVNARR